ncbi:MAG TPA: FAD-dependent oxidoreductase [Solirubrobacteraceae bacterium]|nr:FAD-dependent oxidoreductase [Solirubrobacteraceae bacterium]
MARPDRIVVVGASLAGLRAAEALRARGFEGDLTIVGAERHPPYTRPPLSKQLLAGAQEPGDCALRHDDLGADWRLGTSAVGLDPDRRSVLLSGGEELSYDGLLLATGSAARPWPGPLPRAGVHTLRELDDALALRAAVAQGGPVAVVGAGFVGSEVAATLRGRGLAVTLIDVAPLPMTPLGPRLGRLCAALHAEHGVELRLSAGVEAFEGDERLAAVRLSGGERVPATVAVVATGAVPNVGWLRGSGLTLERGGVLCDAACAAVGVEDVFCAGDIACWPHPLADGEPVRVEHWSNAAEQGAAAAANLLADPGDRVPYAVVPSFWSDQYEVKIQSVGFPHRGTAEHHVVGSLEDRRFLLAYEREGRVVGAAGFRAMRHIPHFRRHVADRAPIEHVLDGAAGPARAPVTPAAGPRQT